MNHHHPPPHQRPPNHHPPPHRQPSNHHPPPFRQPSNHHPPPHRQPSNHNTPPHTQPSNHHTPPHRQPLNHHPPPHRQTLNHHPPPHQPPPNHHYPPPPKPGPKTKRTTLASCIVATIFLIFLIIILFIIYFSLFKPKDPTITVTAVQLPTFTLSTNSSTASFTFSLYAAVKNPNRATFSHFDSSLQLLYSGNQVGFMFIPAGQISPGKTEFMAATFSVQSFPISTAVGGGDVPAMVGPPVSDGIERVKPAMELEMKLEMVGRVRVLWFFSHHVETVADCRVAVTITDGSVLGFHC